MAALGTAHKVRMLRPTSVKGLSNGLAGDGRHMLRAVAEIHHPFWRLCKRPAAADVPVVVRHRCVEVLEPVGHGAEANRAGRAAGALAPETCVPGIDRHPDFDIDVGLRRRGRERYDPAETRQIIEHLSIGCGETAWRYRLGGGDCDFGQCESRQSFTCSGCRSCVVTEYWCDES